MFNTRIQKLKQKEFSFLNPDNNAVWCKVQFNIMWLVDEKRENFFKITATTMYPCEFLLRLSQLKECFKMHPLHSVINKNNHSTSQSLFKFIDMMDHTFVLKQTSEIKTVIQNLIQLHTNSPDKDTHIIELYKMLSKHNV